MKKLGLILLALCMIPCLAVSENVEDYICVQPGDSGADVRIVLESACRLGCIRDLPEETEDYLPEYEAGIRETERILGLNEDGVIYLSEFVEIENAVGKGSTGPLVKELLERLFDLGYINKVLPEPHDTYEARYETAVKNAEKKLGLKADGIITGSEWETLRAQRIKAIDAVKNVKGSVRNNKIVITWSPVQGAAFYRIIRNGTTLCDVSAGEKTQYTDKSAAPGKIWSYAVEPCRYYYLGDISDEIKIPFTTPVKKLTAKQKYIVIRTNQKVDLENYYTVEPADACKQLTWTLTGEDPYQKSHGLVSSVSIENSGSKQMLTGNYDNTCVGCSEKIRITGTTIDGTKKSISFDVYVIPSNGNTLSMSGTDRWKKLAGDQLSLSFSFRSFKFGKEISAYEVTLVIDYFSGNSATKTVTTNRKVSPGQSTSSDQIIISNRSNIKMLRWWVSKVRFSDGVMLEIKENDASESASWEAGNYPWE